MKYLGFIYLQILLFTVPCDLKNGHNARSHIPLSGSPNKKLPSDILTQSQSYSIK